jgi:hypothetical protein
MSTYGYGVRASDGDDGGIYRIGKRIGVAKKTQQKNRVASHKKFVAALKRKEYSPSEIRKIWKFEEGERAFVDLRKIPKNYVVKKPKKYSRKRVLVSIPPPSAPPQEKSYIEQLQEGDEPVRVIPKSIEGMIESAFPERQPLSPYGPRGSLVEPIVNVYGLGGRYRIGKRMGKKKATKTKYRVASFGKYKKTLRKKKVPASVIKSGWKMEEKRPRMVGLRRAVKRVVNPWLKFLKANMSKRKVNEDYRSFVSRVAKAYRGH